MDNNHIFNEKWNHDKIVIERAKKILSVDKMLMIGSCFSRNMIRWLQDSGIILNNSPWEIIYNPFSLYYEFQRVYNNLKWQNYVTMERNKENDSIIFRDAWRTWIEGNNLTDMEIKNFNIDRMAKVYIESSNTFVFIMTLTEVWCCKKEPMIIMNRVPIKSMIDKSSDLWTNRFMDYNEIVSTLSKLINLIFGIKPNCNIVLMVCPIPLKFTASRKNIKVANNLSKSLLICSIHEICTKFSNVEYFPLFEIVETMLRTDSCFYQDDNRHVIPEVIDLVMRVFIENYANHDLNYNHLIGKFAIPKVDIDGKVVGKLKLAKHLSKEKYLCK